MRSTFFFVFLAAQTALSAQTQTIDGIVRDRFSKQTLAGARIWAKSTEIYATSDENGRFRLDNVPVGRVGIEARLTGYEPYATEDQLLTRVKSLFVEIELSPTAALLEETTVLAARNVAEPVNEMALVGARSFTVDETERVAAAVNDPGRVALSYPGVQKGEDDTENQVVVRGNSPVGVLWRLEGIDIPNPNHFALIGSSGGGLTVFSAQLLSRSDFFTGGMPAEYGNALSGAFDVHFRHGNKESRACHARLSLLGLDAAAEGPFRKGRSSYLINYRYSTLDLLNRAGFQLVGERVNNVFQDLSFNLAFNSADNRRIFTVFGISGLSEEHYYPVEDGAERDLKIPNHWEDRRKPANMGVLGGTWTWLPDENSYFKATAALMGSQIQRFYDTLDRTDRRFRFETQRYVDRRGAFSAVYSRKLSSTLRLKTGAMVNLVFFDFFKDIAPRFGNANILESAYGVSINGKGFTPLLQQYAQVQWRPNERWKLNAGYHFLFLGANQSSSAEPRLSVQYQLTARQSISLAYGLHGKTLPLPAYYAVDTAGNTIGGELKILRSNHLVFAWTCRPGGNVRIGAEAYYQRLSRVPVIDMPNSTYWMLNFSEGFPDFTTLSQGTGYNRGIDLTVEKGFSKSWFFIANGSVFSSRFSTDGRNEFPTTFNSRFSSALTLVKEFSFRKNRTLQLSGRYIYSGGFRYTPHDPALSAAAGRYIPDETRINEGQTPNFKRLDLRFAWQFIGRNISGAISLDVQNALNKPYATRIAYDPIRNITFPELRGELVPVLAFQADF